MDEGNSPKEGSQQLDYGMDGQGLDHREWPALLRDIAVDDAPCCMYHEQVPELEAPLWTMTCSLQYVEQRKRGRDHIV